MLYGYIKNNKIISIRILPKVWKNITGFNLLPKIKLQEFGWYPVLEIDNNIEYDSEIERIEKKYKFDSDNNVIIESYKIISNNLLDIKDNKNIKIKNILNSKLLEGCELSLGFRIKCTHNDLCKWIYVGYSLESKDTIDILDYNNNIHTITKEQYDVLKKEVSEHYQKLFKEYMTAKSIIFNKQSSINKIKKL